MENFEQRRLAGTGSLESRFFERASFVKEQLDFIEDLDKQQILMVSQVVAKLPLFCKNHAIDFAGTLLEVYVHQGINHERLAEEVNITCGTIGAQNVEEAKAELLCLQKAPSKGEKDFDLLQELSVRVGYMRQVVTNWSNAEIQFLWITQNGNTHPRSDDLEQHFQKIPCGSNGGVSLQQNGRLFKDGRGIDGSWSVGDGYVTKRRFFVQASSFVSPMDKEIMENAFAAINDVAARYRLQICQSSEAVK
jgi:hypothetical protein